MNIDLSLVNRILRAPGSVAADCRDDQDTARVAQTALIVIVVGALLFGAAVGCWQGGRQIAFAGLKLSLATVGALVLCAPAFYAILAVFDRPWTARSVLSLMLAAGARLSLVLLATTPVLWLAINLGAPYDLTKLLAAFAYALAGLCALVLLLHGVGEGRGKVASLALFVGVFLLVGAQTSWTLRPYIGTPGVHEVALFTREREGGLVLQLLDACKHLGGPTRRGGS
jgi:hypothetical protein